MTRPDGVSGQRPAMIEQVLCNLLHVIRGSQGTSMFARSVWEDADERAIDITGGEKRSCALHVSSLLTWFRFEGRPLCETRHATVKGLLADLERCGWTSVDAPDILPGGVIRWEMREGTEHVGFYIGGSNAVSTCPIAGTPVFHPWRQVADCSGPRAIIQTFNHPVLFSGLHFFT